MPDTDDLSTPDLSCQSFVHVERLVQTVVLVEAPTAALGAANAAPDAADVLQAAAQVAERVAMASRSQRPQAAQAVVRHSSHAPEEMRGGFHRTAECPRTFLGWRPLFLHLSCY